MKKVLELKDIAGYLPYNLKYQNERFMGDVPIHSYNDYEYFKDIINGLEHDIPILRPLSDLYRSIVHNVKEIIPIVECAKIPYPEWSWRLSRFGGYAGHDDVEDYRFSFDQDHFELTYNGGRDGMNIYNQIGIFDFLDELKIDYRGLIDAGLAVDVNRL